MISTLKASRGKIVAGTIDDIKRKDICWIDCVSPTLDELRLISAKTNIDIEELKEYVDPYERPKIIEYDNLSVVVFSAALAKKNTFKTIPIAIFITKTSIITLQKEKIPSIAKIKDFAEKSKIKIFGNPTIFLRYLLDSITNEYFSIFEKLEDKMEKIEEKIIEKHEQVNIKDIFKIKKTLIYFHKSLVANREVVSGIEKEYISILQKKEIYKFRELYNDIIQLIDMEETHREIMTGMIDMYLGKMSNNMNEIMKKLTVYASYILVPTLISGIYGMNFKMMPEINWIFGYVFALGLMFVSVIGMHMFFKKKGWI